MAEMPSAIGVGVEDASLFSSSAGERKLMTHFVVIPYSLVHSSINDQRSRKFAQAQINILWLCSLW
jgi:hypothetical protein